MKKGLRWFAVVLVVMLIAAMVLPMSAMAANGGYWAVVTGAPLGLRLRSGASLGAPVIATLYNGQSVYVLAGPTWYQGIGWMYVRAGSIEGYCAGYYLRPAPAGPGPVEHGWKVTAPAGLRLRSGPGLGYPIMRIVPYGTILQAGGAPDVTASGYVWMEVSVNGGTLWAAKMYLTPV